MKGISYIWLAIFCLAFESLIAQPLFSYNERLDRGAFFSTNDNSKIEIPEAGKINILYFYFTNDYITQECDYLCALQNLFPHRQLVIYQVLLTRDNFTSSSELTSVAPENVDSFQKAWERYLLVNRNIILLVDKSSLIKFFGEMEKPENFNQILERCGLDFSLPMHLTLKEICTQYAKLVQLQDGKENPLSSLIKSDKPKLLFLYRSLCVPCGEDILIKDLLNFSRRHTQIPIEIIFIFRKLKDANINILNNILQTKQCDNYYFYEAQNITPTMERFFVKGNPFLMYFSKDNEFLKAHMGNYLNIKALAVFSGMYNDEK